MKFKPTEKLKNLSFFTDHSFLFLFSCFFYFKIYFYLFFRYSFIFPCGCGSAFQTAFTSLSLPVTISPPTPSYSWIENEMFISFSLQSTKFDYSKIVMWYPREDTMDGFSNRLFFHLIPSPPASDWPKFFVLTPSTK